MKTKLPKSITTTAQAKAYIDQLIENGETYNFEDDAHEVTWGQKGGPTKKQRDQMNVLALQMNKLDDFDPSTYLLEQIEGPRMFIYYYPLKGHTAGDDLEKVRAIDARIEADTHSSRIIVVKLPVDMDPQIRLSITDEIARSLEGWGFRYDLEDALRELGSTP
jgi:hypothetical protein